MHIFLFKVYNRTSFVFCLHLVVCVYTQMCVHICHSLCTERSQGNLQESFLSFPYVGPKGCPPGSKCSERAHQPRTFFCNLKFVIINTHVCMCVLGCGVCVKWSACGSQETTFRCFLVNQRFQDQTEAVGFAQQVLLPAELSHGPRTVYGQRVESNRMSKSLLDSHESLKSFENKCPCVVTFLCRLRGVINDILSYSHQFRMGTRV